MVWILIYWITSGSVGSYGGANIATASVEFSSQDACRSAFAAMRAAKASESGEQGLWGVCTPKNK